MITNLKLNTDEKMFVSKLAHEFLKGLEYKENMTESEMYIECYDKIKEMYLCEIKLKLVTVINKIAAQNKECYLELIAYGNSKEKSQGGGMRAANYRYIHGLEDLFYK